MSETPDVWEYRGYHLKPGEFNTAMVHLYRAEVGRANVWRGRLDATTNWAVLTSGASLSFVFGETGTHHSVIILTTLLVTVFMVIEARRYRYYELWSYRVRLLEVNFFASMLVAPVQPTKDWAARLSESLLHPEFPISIWEAVGRRLRRNYLWLYVLLALVWVLKIALFPHTVASWTEFFQRAAIGDVPGEIVLLIGVVINTALLLVGLLTRNLHEATGEVLPHHASLRLSEEEPIN